MGKLQVRRRGSVLDLLLIFLLLFSLVGTGVRWLLIEQRTQTEPSEMFLLEGIYKNADPRMSDSFGEGMPLYTAVGEYWGEVAKMEMRPCLIRLLDHGVWREGEWDTERQVDYVITVRVACREFDGRILNQFGKALLVGETLELYGERSMIRLLVTKIDKEVFPPHFYR